MNDSDCNFLIVGGSYATRLKVKILLFNSNKIYIGGSQV